MARVHILVADDEQHIRGLLGRWLGEESWEIALAKDGHEALKLLCTNRFEIAILDIRMPYLDGLKVFEAAVKKGIRTRVIFLTGYGTIQLAVQAIKMGAEDFLVKPLEKEDLIAAIQKLLERFMISPDALACRLDEFLKIWFNVPTLNLKDLCREFNISPGYASRMLREHFGTSFRRRLSYHRVQHARELLQTTDEPLKIIAGQCGYRNQHRLAEAFSRIEGMSPKKYREMSVDRRKKCR